MNIFNKVLIIALICACSAIGIVIGQKMTITRKEVGTHPAILLDRAIKVKYSNYRGEVAVRTIVPIEIYWGQTEHHPQEQWLLRVFDVEKNAERIYAFKDIQDFDIK